MISITYNIITAWTENNVVNVLVSDASSKLFIIALEKEEWSDKIWNLSKISEVASKAMTDAVKDL